MSWRLLTLLALPLAVACTTSKDDDDDDDDEDVEDTGDVDGTGGGTGGGGGDEGSGSGSGSGGDGGDGGDDGGGGADWPEGDPTGCNIDGDTFVLDMNSARFLEPAGVGELLLGQLEQDIAIGITDVGGSSIDMFMGFSEGGSQDECTETASLPEGDWNDPVFTVGPTTLQLDVSGFSLPIEDFTLAAAVTSDCGDLRDGVFAGELDARTLAPLMGDLLGTDSPDEICSLMTGFGVNCEPCSSDGAEYCISVLVDQLPADGVSWDLERVTSSDVSNNDECN